MTRTVIMMAAGVVALGSAAGLATSQGSPVQAAAIKHVSTAQKGNLHAKSHAHKRPGIRGIALKDVASALHLPPASLKKDLASGETLTAIATKQGLNPASVQTTLENDAKKALAQAVSRGRMPSQKAAAIETHMAQRIAALMTSTQLKHAFRHQASRMDHHLMGEASRALKVSRSTLRADLKSGKTLAEIAGSHTAATALENTLISNAKATIQKAVASGKLPQAKATAREKQVAARIRRFVNQPHPLALRAAGKRQAFRWTRGLMRNAAKQLGMSSQTLRSDLASGRTLSQLAAQTSGGVKGLESALLKVVDTRVQAAAAKGHIKASRVSTIEAHMRQMIDKRVTHSQFMGHRGWLRKPAGTGTSAS